MIEDNIPLDDITDMLELYEKLTEAVGTVLEDQNLKVTIPVLIHTLVQMIIAQCDNLGELETYRDITHRAFNRAIDHILINPE